VFFAKSAESLENKRVEFLVSAKKRKRVRKSVKRRNLNTSARNEWLLGFAQGELAPSAEGYPHPRRFL
jgi:hypothetical protein